MKLLTAKSRITIGLACLLVSVLCTAVMLGMVPDPASGVLAGRAHLCETIAVASSDYISRKEFRRLKFLLQTVVERNPDVLSAGLRRETGQVLVQIGNHRRLWNTNASDRSTDTHVHVPIRAGADRWGSVELRFRPLRAAGFTGWLEQPWVQLTLFVTSVSYLLFFVYLRKMLEHLDPSKTVPTRVRAALDTLAEGLLVVDNNDRIVLANTAFADWVDRDPNKLIGVKASSVGWTVRGPDQPLRFPWRDAIRERAPQAAVMMQLERPDRSQRTLMANASPVLGHDGKYGGVLVSLYDVTQLEQTKKDLDRAKQVA